MNLSPWRIAPLPALLLAACSLASLDGLSGGTPPDDGGTAPDVPALPDATADAPAADADAAADAGADAGRHAAAVLSDAPTAYFRLADPPGTTVLKNEIAGSPITMLAAAGSRLGVEGIPGTSDTALAVDTIDARIDVGGFDLSDTPEFTVEAWVRLDAPVAPTGGSIFMEMDNGASASRTGTWLLLDTMTGYLFSEMWLVGAHKLYTTTTGALSLGRFLHIVFLHDDRDRLFVDGVEAVGGVLDDGGARVKTATPFHFQGFVGRLDEVAFYNRAIGLDRITAHYGTGLK